MFGWIPFFGPIIDGIVSMFLKKQDTIVEKYKVDGSVDTEAMKTSANILATFKDDISIRILRDCLLVPIIIWTDLIIWVTLMKTIHPAWYFVVLDLPPALSYLPYAAFVFLFGAVGMTMVNRR